MLCLTARTDDSTIRTVSGKMPITSAAMRSVVSPKKFVVSPTARRARPKMRIGRDATARKAPLMSTDPSSPHSSSSEDSPATASPSPSRLPPTVCIDPPSMRMVPPVPTAIASPTPLTTPAVPASDFSTTRSKEKRPGEGNGSSVSSSPLTLTEEARRSRRRNSSRRTVQVAVIV